MFFKVLALAMLLYSVVTFYRTREAWRVLMAVTWALLLFYNFMPRWLAITLLSITLCLTLILKYSLLADIYLFGVLRRLSTQGREARKGLTSKQIEALDTHEFISDERIPKERVAAWLEEEAGREKEFDVERLARQEAEAAKKTEEREMAIEQFNQALEVRFTITEDMPNLWQSAELKLGEQVGALRFSRPLKNVPKESDQEKLLCHLEWHDRHGAKRTSDTWFTAGNEFWVKSEYAAKKMFWWRDADEHWKINFRNRCILAHIYIEGNYRDLFELNIGTEKFITTERYLPYHVDVALSADGRQFCIRVREMLHQIYNGDPLSEDPQIRDAAEQEGVDYLPPFCFEIPVEQVLPITAPYRHALTSEGLDDGAFLQPKIGDAPNI